MTEFPDILITALTARTATVLLDPDRSYFRLDRPLDWVLSRDGTALRRGQATTVVLFLDGLEPDCSYVLSVRGLTAGTEFRTRSCTGLVDIRDFGAAPDLGDNGPAIAAALRAVPAGGTLHVPAGRFTTAPLFLKSHLTLHLDAGATLAAPGHRDGWPILPAHLPDGRSCSSWEGLPDPAFAALITAIDCADIAITGAGVLDGGGDRGDWWDWPKETRQGARRPRTVFLARCRGVSLSGFGVRNSPSWTVHATHCRDLVATGLTIENPPDSPNTDGLNPESCEDVLLAGIRFTVGDDCIAVKAGKRGPGAGEAHLAPTRNLRIRNCRMERGHGAVVMGSEMSGGITDVEIDRCEFAGTDRGLRIKTRRGRGGTVARVSLHHCRMEGVATPLAINAFYFCDADGRSEAVQSRHPAPVDDTTPVIEDISMADVTATGVHLAVAAALGLPESPLRRIRLMRVTAVFDPAARAAPPLMACGVPAIRHQDILSDFAELETDDLRAAPAPEIKQPC